MLGISFEEQGRMPAEEWGMAVGPFARTGSRSRSRSSRRPRPCAGAVPPTALHGALGEGDEFEIESTALPIVAEGGQEGAMIFFWPRTNDTQDPT